MNWSDAANWDTAPTKNTAITFTTDAAGATVIDAAFSVSQVGAVTLPADWTGSVTQQKDITLSGAFTQNGGTWTVNGKTFTVNAAFYVKGGTFDASGSDLVQSYGNTFSHTGGTLKGGRHVHGSNVNHSIDVKGATFDSLKITASDWYVSSGKTLTVNGSAHVTGTLTLEGFLLQSGTLSAGGDVTTTRYADGGTGTILFNGGTHTVTFTPTISGFNPALPNIVVTNGASVTLSAPSGVARLGNRTSSTLRVYNGTLDCSSVDRVEFHTKNGAFSLSDGIAVFKPPKTFCFDARQDEANTWNSGIALDCRNRTFLNLDLALDANGMRLTKGTTNFVSGTLSLHGGGFYSSDADNCKPRDFVAGKLCVRGDVIADRETKAYTSLSSGSGILLFDGTTDQHVWATNMYAELVLAVDKTNGTKVVCHSETPMTLSGTKNGPGVIIKSGTVVFPEGGITMNGLAGDSAFWQSGGTVVASNSALKIEGGGTFKGGFRLLQPIGDLTLNVTASDPNPPVTMGETTTVLRAFNWIRTRLNAGSQTGPYNPHMINALGDVTVTNLIGGGCCGFLFTGSGDQRLTCVASSLIPAGKIVIDKPAGRLVLGSDYDLQKGYHWFNAYHYPAISVEHKRGELDLNGHNLIASGTYQMDAGATVVGDGVGQAIGKKGVTVADGACVGWKPQPSDATLAAAVCSSNKLTLPLSGTVNVEIKGDVTVKTPTRIEAFSYATLANFNRNGFVAVGNPRICPRVRATNDTSRSTVSLNYIYRQGAMIILR